MLLRSPSHNARLLGIVGAADAMQGCLLPHKSVHCSECVWTTQVQGCNFVASFSYTFHKDTPPSSLAHMRAEATMGCVRMQQEKERMVLVQLEEEAFPSCGAWVRNRLLVNSPGYSGKSTFVRNRQLGSCWCRNTFFLFFKEKKVISM